MKIVFAGTPDFAAESLRAILETDHQVVAVYTQPDRPAGRGKKRLKSPVKQLAERHNLTVVQPDSLKSAEAQETLQAFNPDVMIVAAYGLLLPKAVLDIPTCGCVNIHASLLPRWRGAAPIQRAIQAGDQTSGITIMQMDEGLDTGDMLLKLETPISDDDTGGSLHDRLAELGAQAILSYLEQSQSGPLPATPQTDDQASYAPKLSKQEALINWQDSASQILRNIRAFNPWPVAYVTIDPDRIRIWEATLTTDNPQCAPGTVLQKSRTGIVIACGEQAISIQKLQLPGGKAMDVEAFINGGKALFEPGTTL